MSIEWEAPGRDRRLKREMSLGGRDAMTGSWTFRHGWRDPFFNPGVTAGAAGSGARATALSRRGDFRDLSAQFEYSKQLPGVLLVADLAALALSLLAVWGIAHMSAPVATAGGYWQGFSRVGAVLFLIPVCFLFAGLYPGYGMDPVEQLRRRTLAMGAHFIFVLVLVLAGDGVEAWHVQLLVGAMIVALILSALLRHCVRQGAMKRGIWGEPVMIIGSADAVGRAIERLRAYPSIGIVPVCAIRGLDLRAGINASIGRIRGTISSAERNCGEIGYVIIADTNCSDLELKELASKLSGYRLWRSEGRPASAFTMRFVPYSYCQTKSTYLDRVVDSVTALTDRVCCCVVAWVFGLALLMPMLLIALAIKLDSPGPVLFRQRRLGRGGRCFEIIKFRTMCVDAENHQQAPPASDRLAVEEYAKYAKVRNDSRVTRLGRILRKSSLDELPQLFNIARGDMAVIGPRPYMPREKANLGSAAAHILRVRPGLTGLWQVSGRNFLTFDERARIDAYYVQTRSCWLDLWILLRTIEVVIFARGAY